MYLFWSLHFGRPAFHRVECQDKQEKQEKCFGFYSTDFVTPSLLLLLQVKVVIYRVENCFSDPPFFLNLNKKKKTKTNPGRGNAERD